MKGGRHRQLPQVWKWYFLLPNGTDFSFSLDKREVFFKAGLFLADSAERRHTVLVWPFRRVRTTVLLRDVLPGGLSSADLKPWPYGMGSLTEPPCSDKYQYEIRKKYPGSTSSLRMTFDHPTEPHVDDGRTGPSA